MTRSGVLLPAVAGSWYPASAASLTHEVDRLLDAAPDPPVAPAAAVIAPHAGYAYSGGVAAAAFAALRGRSVRRVVLIGPSHYEGFRGGAVPDAGAWRTPLGDVPIDLAACDLLATSRGVARRSSPFFREHSLEAELPFLQRALAPGFSAAPILLGPYSEGPDLAAVARAVEPLLSDDTLVVVSSDFTHYGEAFGYVPFESEVPRRIEELDRGALARIEDADAAGFEDYVGRTGATVCGRHAISVLLRLPLARRSPAVRTLAYATSGSMTGTWDASVSYAAVHVAAAA